MKTSLLRVVMCAAGMLSCSSGAPLYAQTVDSRGPLVRAVAESTIAATVQGLEAFGSREWTLPRRDTVAQWIANQFVGAGVLDVVLDPFTYSGTRQSNIIARFAGSSLSAPEIVVGAHYDSYSRAAGQAPGADDNATGTAGVIEIARILARTGYTPVHPVRCVAFAAEETGLRGSQDYAAKAVSSGRSIRLMLNFDMIGHRLAGQGDRDYFIVTYAGGEDFARLDSEMARRYTTLTPVFTTQYRSGSDSYSFALHGFPSVFCIERDFNPFYHSPLDRSDTLDFAYAADIVRAGLATLLAADAMKEEETNDSPRPFTFALHPAYPNPFNPSTTLRFTLPGAGAVRLEMIDVLGRVVATIVDDVVEAGVHERRWDASGRSSGVYWCRLSGTFGSRTQRVVLLR